MNRMHTMNVLKQNNRYGAVHLIKMFPTTSWILGGLKTNVEASNVICVAVGCAQFILL